MDGNSAKKAPVLDNLVGTSVGTIPLRKAMYARIQDVQEPYYSANTKVRDGTYRKLSFLRNI